MIVYHSVQILLSSRLLSKIAKIKIYKTIILAVILYRCETWFLTLREKRRLKIFENGVLRTFAPKRDQTKVGWRNLHEELRNLNFSPNIITTLKSRRLRRAGHLSHMVKNAYRVWVGKPKGKRPLGRSRRRLEDNIKKDLIEIGWDGMDWIDLTPNRDQWRALANTAMNLQVP
jgi:hypothetical protein